MKRSEGIEKQVRNIEQQDPHLRQMKDAINELSAQIKSVSSDQVAQLLQQQNLAIQNLLGYVESKYKN